MKKTVLLLLLSITVQIQAQLFRHLDIRDGLSSHRVLAIAKDGKGYMWFLTQEGIDRYNGKQFVHYPLGTAGRKLQQFPNLNRLQMDSQGGIWVTGKNGYCFRYDERKDSFALRLDFVGRTQTANKLPLTHTYLDEADNLWLTTRDAQYLYDISDDGLRLLHSNLSEEITSLVQSAPGTYFIGTNRGIYRGTLRGDTLRVKPVMMDIHIVHNLYYHAPTEQLLIGTLMDGFYLYSNRTGEVMQIGNMKDVNMNRVVPMRTDPDKLLVATDGNGIVCLDMKERTMNPYHPAKAPDTDTDRNGDIIKDIYIDNMNRIWTTVFPMGVTVLDDGYPSVELISRNHGIDRQGSDNPVTCLLEDADGDIWTATVNGVECYNPRTGTWRTWLREDTDDSGQRNHVFISLCESSPGVILVGGYMAGMYRIDKRSGEATYLLPHGNIRPDKYIRSIYRDRDGNVWAGGYYNFKRIDPINGDVEHYNTEYPITCITGRNTAGELWIGTINGLYRFDRNSRSIHRVNLDADMGNINTIYQDGEEKTYIGTNGQGLWVYDNQTQNLENFRLGNSSLLSDNIYCILPGKKSGEMVLSTENGLVSFQTAERVFLNWTQEQGLPEAKFNIGAGVHTRNGKVAFGTGNGILVTGDSIRLPRRVASKLVFTDFNIHYRKMMPGEENSPLVQSIDDTNSITLQHDQNIFSLNVSSINYDCPSRILYSWKLEGFYEEWTRPGEAHLIRYTNIGPGKYWLRVRAILLDDGHILEERSIEIIVRPPFSQTVWAWMIYLMLAGVLVSAVMRYLWLRKDSNLSKEKIRFFIHTAHDIRTPLTLIKAPLSELENQERLSERGRKNLELAMKSTDNLSELATKLIEFQKEELYTTRVNVVRLDLNEYLEDYLQQFEGFAARKGIRLELHTDGKPLSVWVDRNKMDPILHNLISNALKYTPQGGEVRIETGRTGRYWTLAVADTGIGIAESDRKKLFKHLFRGNNAVNLQVTGSGIGLLQTYRLVKRHRGKIRVESKEGEGTTFRLRFPLENRHYRQTVEGTEPSRSRPLTAALPGMSVPESPSDVPTPSPEEPDRPQKATVLLVEDHTDLRRFIRQSLSDLYRVREASNGREALERIAEEQPDVVLSDILMPVMRGDDLCRTLKGNVETSHIPVILLSALTDRESILHGLSAHADNYLVKPFETDILRATIASVLANKELVRRRFARLDYRTESLPPEVQDLPGMELDQEFLTRTTELIRSNLRRELSVDWLCVQLGLSRSSFYHKVKVLTGRSPLELVRHIRLEEACTLLRSQRYTVAEVSDRVGYGDPKYFTDLFKKHYGLTPSAYLKQDQP